MRLSIQFCGGCNSRIDRGRCAGEIKDYFSKYGMTVIANDLEADVILYMSGCAANCAERYNESDKMSVVIAGETVNAIAVDMRRLSSVAIEKIKLMIAGASINNKQLKINSYD